MGAGVGTAVGAGVGTAVGAPPPPGAALSPCTPPRLHSIAGRGASFLARYKPHALHSEPPPTRSFLQNGVRLTPQLTHVFVSPPLAPRFFPRFDEADPPESLASSPESEPMIPRSRFLPPSFLPAWGAAIAAAAAAMAC